MEFITLLSDHPQYAGLIIVGFMFLESAPVVGFFLPGIFFLSLLGAMAVSSGDTFWYFFSCSVTGAFIGDLLGFSLGRVSAHKWQPNVLSKHRQRTSKLAQELLGKHGLLAIFLARFIWLIHPAIPGAAGLLGVKLHRFILLDLPAVFLWVLIYMGGGQLLRGWWINQKFQLFEILALITAMLVLLWGLRYGIHLLLRRYQKQTDQQFKNR